MSGNININLYITSSVFFKNESIEENVILLNGIKRFVLRKNKQIKLHVFENEFTSSQISFIKENYDFIQILGTSLKNYLNGPVNLNKENILIDNVFQNLYDWNHKKGKSIFFYKRNQMSDHLIIYDDETEVDVEEKLKKYIHI